MQHSHNIISLNKRTKLIQQSQKFHFLPHQNLVPILLTMQLNHRKMFLVCYSSRTWCSLELLHSSRHEQVWCVHCFITPPHSYLLVLSKSCKNWWNSPFISSIMNNSEKTASEVKESCVYSGKTQKQVMVHREFTLLSNNLAPDDCLQTHMKKPDWVSKYNYHVRSGTTIQQVNVDLV